MTTFSTTRLYIGNLAASCDEYTLMQLCSKHGKISKLDYLFHKTGPAKGKPRGYAFIEYSTKEEALRAMVALHDKLVRGRNIIVTAASEQSTNPDDVRLAALSGKGNARGRTNDASRPTAISLLKGQGVAAAKSTNGKIAALEAKLAALRRNKPEDASPSSSIPTSRDNSPLPAASTSSTTTLDPAAGERWLDSIVPPSEKDAEGTSGGSKRPVEEAEDGGAESLEKKRRKMVQDGLKAGLPARPTFDAPEPEKEN
ncbi:RNA-binding protein 18, partial [Phenoliferia sp. Uapishka_3]